MSKSPIVDLGSSQTFVVDEVCAVQRLYGLTRVAFVETRPSTDPLEAGQGMREVTVRLAIPTERVAAICAALMAGTDQSAFDDGKATVRQCGRA